MLYIVATPIGNLKDITLRAIEVLKNVDLIACEDTRHTHILLREYGVTTPVTSYFQQNRFSKGDYLIGVMQEGRSVALVSDAGTPGILDPGYHLINTALQRDIPVTAVPGASAFVSALILSGKPAHEFHFAGFLSAKRISRRNRLSALFGLGCTVIVYESCHRIIDTLADIADLDARRRIACCRELTKKFEEVLRGTAQEIARTLKQKRPRGEFVLVI